ncbi:MAG TPA: Nif3-like dinuclear metal center hexameric protein [Herpetosiphonaceae bacterium]|nr:Nif3-like dinuclear metal center hexameric protein [Herpetosiphonaceae bacterium]
MQLAELTRYLDGYLNNAAYADSSLNGLQVEGRAEVGTVALAVDASLAAIDGAAAGGADLLLTHHGLFWGRREALTGWLGRRVRRLMTAEISLYTSHLPLDAHLEVGNNAELLRVLGWESAGPFGAYKGKTLGFVATPPAALSLGDLSAHIAARLEIPDGELRTWGAAARPIRRIGVISGGAAESIAEAIAAGCDALLTGEPNYGSTFPAIEEGVPLICAGHYHTETLGVKALGAHLEARFGLQTFFIPDPVGV